MIQLNSDLIIYQQKWPYSIAVIPLVEELSICIWLSCTWPESLFEAAIYIQFQHRKNIGPILSLSTGEIWNIWTVIHQHYDTSKERVIGKRRRKRYYIRLESKHRCSEHHLCWVKSNAKFKINHLFLIDSKFHYRWHQRSKESYKRGKFCAVIVPSFLSFSLSNQFHFYIYQVGSQSLINQRPISNS